MNLSSNTRLTVLPLVMQQGPCARGAQPPCQAQCLCPLNTNSSLMRKFASDAVAMVRTLAAR